MFGSIQPSIVKMYLDRKLELSPIEVHEFLINLEMHTLQESFVVCIKGKIPGSVHLPAPFEFLLRFLEGLRFWFLVKIIGFW